MTGSDLTNIAPHAPARARRRPLRALARAGYAWCTLLRVRTVLALGGFRGLQRSLATLGNEPPLPPECRRVVIAETVTAIARARRACVAEVACLQRAATCVLMLRQRGVPAELVVGVQRTPFVAHAWTEVDGIVVDDSAETTGAYTVITRT